jgi:membrane protein YqaA with SNARE-associated domain
MREFLTAIFAGLMNWWGLWLIAALDSTMLFFLPLAVDIAVIVLSSRAHEMFWVYPLIAAGGSLCGAAVTYYIGYRVGDPGLERFVSPSRLERVRKKMRSKGAIAIAILDLVPPPFPFTAFVLAAGALEVSAYRFFFWLLVTRLLRFGAEGVAAFFYGRQIIDWFNTPTFEYIATFLFAVAVLGTVLATVQVIRSTRGRRGAPSRRPAA